CIPGPAGWTADGPSAPGPLSPAPAPIWAPVLAECAAARLTDWRLATTAAVTATASTTKPITMPISSRLPRRNTPVAGCDAVAGREAGSFAGEGVGSSTAASVSGPGVGPTRTMSALDGVR